MRHAPWRSLQTDPFATDPFAIIVSGAEIQLPIETIFDVGAGELIVQQCAGSIAGRTLAARRNDTNFALRSHWCANDQHRPGTGVWAGPGATLFDSIEYAVSRFAPKLLVVMGESYSILMDKALEQISGAAMPPEVIGSAGLTSVLNRLMISAMYATRTRFVVPQIHIDGAIESQWGCRDHLMLTS